MKKIIVLCDYNSNYGGNFIPSLISLEEKKRDLYKYIYVFPIDAKNKQWMTSLKNSGRIIEFIEKSKNNYINSCRIQKILKKYNSKVLYVHFWSFKPIALISIFHRSIKIFIHMHSDFSNGKKTLRLKLKHFILYKCLLRKCYYLSVSNDLLDFLPKKNSYYIPNALATKRIDCIHQTGEDFRNKYGIAKENVIIECFGWSPYVKGIDIAVRSVKKARDLGYKELYLLIICGVSFDIDKMKLFIKENTDCYGNENWIMLVNSNEDVFRFHEAADVCLSASRSEGFSYALLEMMSLGKRCIISDIPGTDWATKYENVEIFKSENVDSCMKSIIKTLDKKNVYPIVKKDILENYSIDQWCFKIIELFNEILQQ